MTPTGAGPRCDGTVSSGTEIAGSPPIAAGVVRRRVAARTRVDAVARRGRHRGGAGHARQQQHGVVHEGVQSRAQLLELAAGGCLVLGRDGGGRAEPLGDVGTEGSRVLAQPVAVVAPGLGALHGAERGEVVVEVAEPHALQLRRLGPAASARGTPRSALRVAGSVAASASSGTRKRQGRSVSEAPYTRSVDSEPS